MKYSSSDVSKGVRVAVKSWPSVTSQCVQSNPFAELSVDPVSDDCGTNGELLPGTGDCASDLVVAQAKV